MIIFLVAVLADLPQTKACPAAERVYAGARCIVLDGKKFTRLNNTELRSTIVNTSVNWLPPRNPHPADHIFLKSGLYAFEGDRSYSEGRYRIAYDSVWVERKGEGKRRMVFYRSADGQYAKGEYGVGRVGTVTVTSLGIRP